MHEVCIATHAYAKALPSLAPASPAPGVSQQYGDDAVHDALPHEIGISAPPPLPPEPLDPLPLPLPLPPLLAPLLLEVPLLLVLPLALPLALLPPFDPLLLPPPSSLPESAIAGTPSGSPLAPLHAAPIESASELKKPSLTIRMTLPRRRPTSSAATRGRT